MNRAGFWCVQNESKNQMGLPEADSGWSVCRWMASTNPRIRALRSSGSRVVRHHSSTSRTIPTVWLALRGPHTLSPACTHAVSRCESESRPTTGVSPLASATRWGSTPQRVSRGSNHQDLSRTLRVTSAALGASPVRRDRFGGGMAAIERRTGCRCGMRRNRDESLLSSSSACRTQHGRRES